MLAENDTAWIPQKPAPYVSVYDLKLQNHSDETKAQFQLVNFQTLAT